MAPLVGSRQYEISEQNKPSSIQGEWYLQLMVGSAPVYLNPPTGTATGFRGTIFGKPFSSVSFDGKTLRFNALIDSGIELRFEGQFDGQAFHGTLLGDPTRSNPKDSQSRKTVLTRRKL